MADHDDPPPEDAFHAFDDHDQFEATDGGFALTTTEFENLVAVASSGGSTFRYTVTVRVPMLSSTVQGTVGPAVEDGWFDTLELRLEDAVDAIRQEVVLADYALDRDGPDAVARYVFEWETPDSAPDVAKSVVGYVEGTYLQGVVPGYEYRDPVAGMLARARQAEDGGGPMPL